MGLFLNTLYRGRCVVCIQAERSLIVGFCYRRIASFVHEHILCLYAKGEF